jgi:hypothetical protein
MLKKKRLPDDRYSRSRVASFGLNLIAFVRSIPHRLDWRDVVQSIHPAGFP